MSKTPSSPSPRAMQWAGLIVATLLTFTPIIVRPVDWSGAPFGRLQVLPKNAKPVVLWANRDVAWVDVAKDITKVAKALAANLKVELTTRGPLILPSIAVAPLENSARQLSERPGGQLQRTNYHVENS